MRRLLLLAACLTVCILPASAQQDMADVVIEAQPVAGNVYMLTGRGGNIGLSVGADGAFLIDDQYAPLTDKIQAAVAELTDAPIRFVVNTHWHGDHTGGNENLGEAGALIVAHENVRERMSTEQFNKLFNRTTPPSPEAALPVITFTDAMTFYWNDDALHVHHVGPAHTDGDAILFFEDANVLHTGDIYFNGLYPFIDASSGGDVAGVVAAVDRLLALGDEDTRVIPGHGPLSDKAGLRAYRAMLQTVHDRVQAMIDEGMTQDEVVAAKPTAEFDADWGGGFLPPDRWVALVYDAMSE